MSDPFARARIRRLLEAQSVAIVGASGDDRKIGNRPVRFLSSSDFAGRVYPVNPKLAECCGLPCFPTLTALPECPDLVVVVVNATLAPSVLEEAGSLGVPSAIVLSSGFAELGGRGSQLQADLVDIARKYGITMCGPNSVGVVHTPTNLVATFSEALTRGGIPAGSIGVVSQSGAYGTILLAEARARGLGIRTYVSTGNEAALGLGDYIGALVEDPEVRVIGGYVEGISDATAFVEALDDAVVADKPVVLLKAGRSDRGGAAAASHTGALAGRDEVYEAVFRRHGVVRARADAEFVDILEAFETLDTLPSGSQVAVVTMSGGAGVLIADLVDEVGLEMATFSEVTTSQLNRILPTFASIANPVDLTGQFVTNGDGLLGVLATIGADSGVDIVIAYEGLAWQTDGHWFDAIAELAGRGIPVLVVRPVAEPEVHSRYRAVGVPVYHSASSAVNVARAIVGWGIARAKRTRAVGMRSSDAVSAAPATRLVNGRDAFPPARHRSGGAKPSWLEPLDGLAGVIREEEAKKILARFGLMVPRGATARSPQEACCIAAGLGGRVVLKIDAPGVLHKTEIGGVIVGVAQDDVSRAFASLIERAAAAGFRREELAVRVEELVAGGVEFMVGAVRSNPFGTMIAVGLGGTVTELIGDIAFAIAPVVPAEAAQMLASLRTVPILRGYRGGVVLDEQALIEVICGVSQMADNLGDRLVELDCNPVLVRPLGKGAVVIDAALVLTSGQGSTGPGDCDSGPGGGQTSNSVKPYVLQARKQRLRY